MGLPTRWAKTPTPRTVSTEGRVGTGVGGGPGTHQQVDSQLDLLKTVDELGLSGGSCTQSQDTLWNGGRGSAWLAFPAPGWGASPPAAHLLGRSPAAGAPCLLRTLFSPPSPSPSPHTPHSRLGGTTSPSAPAGPFFPFFFPFFRWFSCLKASAAFCSRATNHSMSSRAQLRICWGQSGGGGQSSGAGTAPHTFSWSPAWGRRWVLPGGWLEGPPRDGDPGR